MSTALRFSMFLVVLWTMPAWAQSAADPALAAALRAGGNVIVLRHGATHAEQVDAKPFDPADIVHQRQLNEQGRATARSMGDALHRLGVTVSGVQTSQYYRAVETGTLLGFGTVVAVPALNEGGTTSMAQGNADRGAVLLALVATPPAAGTNVVLVTHKPNIVGALGKDWSDVGEGEATILRPDGHGGYALVARVLAVDWPTLAKAN